MVRLNVAQKSTETTHEGAPAARINPEQALRRSVLSCLLWEDEFYEDGQEIAARIVKLVGEVDPAIVAALAIEARHRMNLRHVPLLLCSAMAKSGGLGWMTLESVIDRADEIAEFVAIHAKVNKTTPDKIKQSKMLSYQVRRGLAAAFAKFDEYQLAKYDREGAIRLRDVAILARVKAADNKRRGTFYAKLINKTFYPEKTKSGFPVKSAYELGDYAPLLTPDTWEVGLSTGGDKKETFTRLLVDRKLGYLALLRNLRNMTEAGVDIDLIKGAIIARRGGAERVLPFRYVAAARACPQLEPAIDQALCEAVSQSPVFGGRTYILVDVSGSMEEKLSGKSDMKRIDAAAALASMINGDRRVWTFSNGIREVPPRFGMAGVDAIIKSQDHGATYLGLALNHLQGEHIPDRLIVITDEQSHDKVPSFQGLRHAYMINVASNKNGVGYGAWTHIDGFSEGVLRYIREVEAE